MPTGPAPDLPGHAAEGNARPPVLTPRPWWARIAAGFLLACLAWLLVGVAADSLFGPEYSLISHAVRAGLTLILVLAGLAALLRWEGTRASDYGLVYRKGTLWALLVGALSYLVPFALAASVVFGLGLAQLQVTGEPLMVLAQGLVVLALVVLYEALPEELIFRGYLFRVLSERLPISLTIVVQAVLFCGAGIIVGAAPTLDRVLLFFVFSLTLGYLRHVAGTVFVTIGFHAMFQLCAQWALGEQWATLTVTDASGWFAIAALGVVPFALAPVVAGILDRLRRGRTGDGLSAPTPDHDPQGR
ncbi:CPBP family intramembrane glutamic endopeptidase [Mycetocola zhujimingii]|uniref:CPBP family intramembrane glutamic endopeptidase n=1 Tax=Mycetocola zhujimingii TaxID=2079792 RepID=UPI000D3A39D0|nr:type II CAAX endopeptidase family protein [Mycetocola zhujimingii]AWB86961.1 CPBP family intramembrane metalloprotease [Mycetocola zhujimingii]